MNFHDEEWRLIGRSLLLGLFLSFLYDFLRSVRWLGHRGRAITFLCDILFAFCAGAASFALLQQYSDGMLRWYAVGAAGLAIWLYGKFRKIFLTKVKEAVIMKIHPERKEADNDETGIQRQNEVP